MRNLFRLSYLLFVGVPVALTSPVWAQSASDTGSVRATSASSECGRSAIEYADEEGLSLEEKIQRMDRALTRSLNRYDECQEPEDDKLEPEPEDPTAQGTEPESGDGAEAENAAAESQATESAEGQSESAAPGDISGDETDPTANQNPSATALPSLTPPSSGSAGTTGGQAGSAQAGGIEGDGEGTPADAGAPSVAAGDIAGDEPDPEPAWQAGAGSAQDPRQAGQAGGAGNGTVAGTGPRVLNNGKLPEDIPSSDNDSVLEAQIRQAAIDESDPELKKKLWNEYRRYKGLPQIK